MPVTNTYPGARIRSKNLNVNESTVLFVNDIENSN